VTENERTTEAKFALINGDWKLFGRKMNESHESMKVDYEVSCGEIDFLAETAQTFDGVYGSRLTGGGFGGCTVTLVKRSRVEALSEHLKAEYKSRWGMECSCFETVPGAGARELSLE
jgi:galactokinase